MVIKQQMNHVRRPFEEREKRKMSPAKEGKFIEDLVVGDEMGR